MISIKGKSSGNEAECFAPELDSKTAEQIEGLLDNPSSADGHVRIMPDCHAGSGCVIGTTMCIKGKVVPNVVGVDIGCGLLAYRLGKASSFTVDVLKKIDDFVNESIPCGFNVRDNPAKGPEAVAAFVDLNGLRCSDHIEKKDRLEKSLGTLGGGNHFISIECSDEYAFLVIHTGSRNLGTQMADFYQREAISDLHKAEASSFDEETKEGIADLKEAGKQKCIATYMSERADLRKSTFAVPDELCYLEGQHFEDYIFDMGIAQHFAYANRRQICRDIVGFVNGLGLTPEYDQSRTIESVHNYIDIDHMILRKGAISARKGEKCIIPLNMRDGTLLCVGKGNPDWNYSAPHGAGRRMSRTEAKAKVDLKDYVDSMKGIYSTSVCEGTIDESPFAYKNEDDIIKAIEPAVSIETHLKPIYNFKAKDEPKPWQKKKTK